MTSLIKIDSNDTNFKHTNFFYTKIDSHHNADHPQKIIITVLNKINIMKNTKKKQTITIMIII